MWEAEDRANSYGKFQPNVVLEETYKQVGLWEFLFAHPFFFLGSEELTEAPGVRIVFCDAIPVRIAAAKDKLIEVVIRTPSVRITPTQTTLTFFSYSAEMFQKRTTKMFMKSITFFEND